MSKSVQTLLIPILAKSKSFTNTKCSPKGNAISTELENKVFWRNFASLIQIANFPVLCMDFWCWFKSFAHANWLVGICQFRVAVFQRYFFRFFFLLCSWNHIKANIKHGKLFGLLIGKTMLIGNGICWVEYEGYLTKAKRELTDGNC